MKPSEVQAVVCEVLGEIQAAVGQDVPKMDGKTVPLGKLPHFDSYRSFVATGAIGRRCGLNIPPKLNLFGESQGKHSIDEIADIVCGMLADEEAISEKASR